MRKRWLVAAVLVLGMVAARSMIASAKIAASERALSASGSPSVHGPSDPEVQKGLNAYGAEHYDQARQVAEKLLKERNRGSTHGEAVNMLVESWLAQGDFARARAAAQQYHAQAPRESREALARVDQQEADYRAELKRYQAQEAAAARPPDAAQAHLRIAHLYHQYGLTSLAEAAYDEVTTKYPQTEPAQRAQRQLDALHGKPVRLDASHLAIYR